MKDFLADQGDSPSVALGLRSRRQKGQLFTPSPLITPTLTVRPIHRSFHFSIALNHLIDFDQEIQPTASSHGSSYNHKSQSPVYNLPNIKAEKIQEGDEEEEEEEVEEYEDSEEEEHLMEEEEVVDEVELKKRLTRSRTKKIKKVKIEKVTPEYSPKQPFKVQRRGRKRMYGELEDILIEHLRERIMSRLEIQEFAKVWAKTNNKAFSASNGWYEKFINRLKKNDPSVLCRVSRFEDDKKPRKYQNRGRKKGVLVKKEVDEEM